MEAGVGAMEAATGGGDVKRASAKDMDPGVVAGGVAAGGGDKNNASDKDIDAGVAATGVGSAVGVAGWLSSGVLVCRARVEEASRADTARMHRPKLGVAPIWSSGSWICRSGVGTNRASVEELANRDGIAPRCNWIGVSS